MTITHCNVLTIHQTIPIQGRANVTLSLDVTSMTCDLDDLIQQLKRLDFVESAEVISSEHYNHRVFNPLIFDKMTNIVLNNPNG